MSTSHFGQFPRILFLFPALALGFAAACGDDGGSSGASGRAPDQICASMAQAICHARAICLTGQELAAAGLPASEADCRAEIVAQCAPNVAICGDGIHDYDASAAGACMAGLDLDLGPSTDGSKPIACSNPALTEAYFGIPACGELCPQTVFDGRIGVSWTIGGGLSCAGAGITEIHVSFDGNGESTSIDVPCSAMQAETSALPLGTYRYDAYARLTGGGNEPLGEGTIELAGAHAEVPAFRMAAQGGSLRWSWDLRGWIGCDVIDTIGFMSRDGSPVPFDKEVECSDTGTLTTDLLPWGDYDVVMYVGVQGQFVYLDSWSGYHDSDVTDLPETDTSQLIGTINVSWPGGLCEYMGYPTVRIDLLLDGEIVESDSTYCYNEETTFSYQPWGRYEVRLETTDTEYWKQGTGNKAFVMVGSEANVYVDNFSP